MNVSLQKKVLGLMVVSMLIFMIAISMVSISNIVSRGDERSTAYRETILSEKKQQIKGFVEMAVTLITGMPADEMKKTIGKMHYGESGYLWINDFNHYMVSHPDKQKMEGTDQSDLKDPNGVYILREITKTVRENGEGFLHYSYMKPGQKEMIPKLSFAKAIPGTEWIVGTGIYIDDIDREVTKDKAKIKQEISNTIIQYLVILISLSVILLGGAAYLVNRFISGPVQAISSTIKNFNNDLTLRVPVTTEDEIGTLASWFNEHVANLHRVILMVSEVTERINVQSKTMASTTDQQSSFTTELSSAVVEISSTMEEFSSTANEIAQHSKGVVERADKTLEETRRGASEVETLNRKINDVSVDIQANLGEIVALGRKSKEINKIMEIINNIANQTKLIAFNAALEAASAGDAGKRFGVVAVEIRRLADSVVESTGEIEGKINEILDAVNRLVMSSEKTSNMTREGQQYATQTVEILLDIVESVEEMTGAARQISLSTQQQQIASGQVLLALKDIEQGMHQSTDSVFTVNSVTGELAQLSEKLKSLVMLFKLNPEDQFPLSDDSRDRA
jgi:methyl-accepting chemotaxis protein